VTHYPEEDLILYYYGEGPARAEIERHLDGCASCTATYRAIGRTLAMVPASEPPERGDQYGLEVWQRIRYRLPEQAAPWWITWLRWDRPGARFGSRVLVIAAFVAGRVLAASSGAPAPRPRR
jgi:anti-sigma factor RsiW